MTRRLAVLAVCTANICRSPLMESALRRHLDPARFEVASAGTRGWRGAPVDGMVALEMARLDLTLPQFASRRLTAAMIGAADLVLTATREHRSTVVDLDPTALRRTFTLRELDGLLPDLLDPATGGFGSRPLAAVLTAASHRRSVAPRDLDVPDPYGRPPAVHRDVADLVVDSCRRVAEAVNALPPA